MSRPVRTNRPAPSRVLTVDEVAERLGVSRRTIYRLILDGALRTVNVAVSGTRIRVRDDDVATFIESRTAEAPDVDPAILAAGA